MAKEKSPLTSPATKANEGRDDSISLAGEPAKLQACQPLFNIENLVLRARSEFNGFAGAGANHFGVLEFWSIGVLAKTKARI